MFSTERRRDAGYLGYKLQALDDVQFRDFIENLERNKDVEWLDLNGSDLSRLNPVRWYALRKALENLHPKHLDLGYCNIGNLYNVQLEDLYKILGNFQLTGYLNLSGNHLDSFLGIQWIDLVNKGLKNSHVQCLNLSNNNFGQLNQEQLNVLCQTIKILSPQALGLSQNKFCTTSDAFQWSDSDWGIFLEYLEKIPRLQSLDLSENALGKLKSTQCDVLCKLLGRLNLKYLNLSGNFSYSNYQKIDNTFWNPFFEAFGQLTPEQLREQELDLSNNGLMNLDDKCFAYFCEKLKKCFSFMQVTIDDKNCHDRSDKHSLRLQKISDITKKNYSARIENIIHLLYTAHFTKANENIPLALLPKEIFHTVLLHVYPNHTSQVEKIIVQGENIRDQIARRKQCI